MLTSQGNRTGRRHTTSLYLLPPLFDVLIVAVGFDDLTQHIGAVVSFACHFVGTGLLAWIAIQHRKANQADYAKVTEWARVSATVMMLFVVAALASIYAPSLDSGMKDWAESALVPLIGIGTLLAAIGPAWSNSAEVANRMRYQNRHEVGS